MIDQPTPPPAGSRSIDITRDDQHRVIMTITGPDHEPFKVPMNFSHARSIGLQLMVVAQNVEGEMMQAMVAQAAVQAMARSFAAAPAASAAA